MLLALLPVWSKSLCGLGGNFDSVVTTYVEAKNVLDHVRWMLQW